MFLVTIKAFLGFLTIFKIMLLLVLSLGCLYFGGLNGQGTVPPNSRIDCDPSPGSSQQICQQRGCIWDSNFDSVS